MRNKFVSLLVIFCFLLSACVPSYTIEELAVISGRGIDFTDDNKLEKTLNILRFDPQAEDIYTTISGTGNTLKGARENAAYQTSFRLVEGQLNVEIYGKEVAQQGIIPYINASVRDARASDTMKLMVSKSTAKEIFNSDSPKSQTLGSFLDKLVDKEVSEGKLPPSSLHDFTRATESVGQDGIMPLVGLEETTPKIIGLALFQGYRFVSEIPLNYSTLLNLFRHKLTNSPIELNLTFDPFKKHVVKEEESKRVTDDGETLSIQINVVNGDSKTTVKNLEELTFQTDIDMDVGIMELSEPISIEKQDIAKIFEKEMEKEFKQLFEDFLNQAQEVNADPFGFGEIYRTKTKDGKLTDKEWRGKFPDIKVDFNVNVKLMNYGTLQ